MENGEAAPIHSTWPSNEIVSPEENGGQHSLPAAAPSTQPLFLQRLEIHPRDRLRATGTSAFHSLPLCGATFCFTDASHLAPAMPQL
ncbi:MAG: hypothetical protein KJ070_22495 [Verrucomicrobia bacterium]|nr:hypothetical protein [Verrucomicrobiota bacterium]